MKLDTLSLTTRTEYIRHMNKDHFNHSVIVKPNGKQIENYSLVTNSFGFEKVSVNPTFDTVNIKVNSKILKDNYFKGININTLDQLLYELAREGLQLDPCFLYDSRTKLIHVTDDISVSKPTFDYFTSLSHLLAPNFVKTVYDEGIVFKEKIFNQPLYLTIYGKEYQIKQDKRFFKAYPEQLQYFSNKIRIESKLSTSKTIGKYIGGSILPEILETGSPNALFLEKIIGKQLEFPSFLPTEDLSCTEEKNLFYTCYLDALYNGDREKIAAHIKGRLGKNTKTSYQMKQLDRFLAIIHNKRDGSIKDNINEIQELLKPVALLSA